MNSQWVCFEVSKIIIEFDTQILFKTNICVWIFNIFLPLQTNHRKYLNTVLWRFWKVSCIYTRILNFNVMWFLQCLYIYIYIYIYIYMYVCIYTGCNRRNVRDFRRVFLRSNYTDITQNTYIQSWTFTEIMAGEVWNFDSCYSLIDYQIHIETGRNMWFL